VVVNLELLQRAVAVEVERDLVRPCAQHRPDNCRRRPPGFCPLLNSVRYPLRFPFGKPLTGITKET
jgi:hypothetical protein